MLKTISLFIAFITVGVISIAQVSKDSSDLEVIGRANDAEYLIRKSSVNVDPSELSVEFEFHTKFSTPISTQGKQIGRLVERVLVMCAVRTVVVTEQLWYDVKDERVGGARSSKVYGRGMTKLQNGLVDFVCGSTQPNQKQPQKSDQTA